MLKRITISLLSILFALQISLGQSSGKVVMSVTKVASPNPEILSQMKMMEGAKTTIYFQGDKSLVDKEVIPNLLSYKTVSTTGGNIQMFFDLMGTKMYVETDEEEFEKQKANRNLQPKITKLQGDTKMISGYKCHKVTAEYEIADGKMSIWAYVTTDIESTANKVIEFIDNEELGGFPLEFGLEAPSLRIHTSTLSVDTSVDSNVFEIDKTGYEQISFDEFIESIGSMTQGFGF